MKPNVLLTVASLLSLLLIMFHLTDDVLLQAEGSVKYFIPRPNGDAVGPEGVSVDAQGTVYGASNEGKRIDRFARK